MISVRYVDLTPEEYQDADGTVRNDKLHLQLAGENRNIRKLYLDQPTDDWQGWVAEINGPGD